MNTWKRQMNKEITNSIKYAWEKRALWWFIASINNLKSNNIEAGTQLRVPISTEQAILK